MARRLWVIEERRGGRWRIRQACDTKSVASSVMRKLAEANALTGATFRIVAYVPEESCAK